VTEEHVLGALERARSFGFLGPGPISAHVTNADGFGEVIEEAHGIPRRLLDLGSGGGVPGLLLADRWPATVLTLLDAMKRRCEFLRDVVTELRWDQRVSVRAERAEVAAHDLELRERFDVVTARGFGPPGVTAEIAAGFTAIDGVAVVSEPPEGSDRRWSAAALAMLGFDPAEELENDAGHFAVLRKRRVTELQWPRAVGRPKKKPLF
jgi:16S rRNA (guanine527-N7)-methyltransferase